MLVLACTVYTTICCWEKRGSRGRVAGRLRCLAEQKGAGEEEDALLRVCLRGERGPRETLWAFELSLIMHHRSAALCCAHEYNDSSFWLPLRP